MWSHGRDVAPPASHRQEHPVAMSAPPPPKTPRIARAAASFHSMARLFRLPGTRCVPYLRTLLSPLPHCCYLFLASNPRLTFPVSGKLNLLFYTILCTSQLFLNLTDCMKHRDLRLSFSNKTNTLFGRACSFNSNTKM